MITGTTEAVQYDHPNHTVTVTTISDLDLTGAHLLKPSARQVNADRDVFLTSKQLIPTVHTLTLTLTISAFKASGEGEDEEKREEEEAKTAAVPRKAGNPIMNKK